MDAKGIAWWSRYNYDDDNVFVYRGGNDYIPGYDGYDSIVFDVSYADVNIVAAPDGALTFN